MNIALVKDLNGEHRAILGTVNRIAAIGALTTETRGLLKETKERIVAHLGKEEREFYPAMRALAASSPSIDAKLKVMNREMESIAAAALRFLDEYADGGSPERFAMDFSNFRHALSERIQREEFALYSHFLKHA